MRLIASAIAFLCAGFLASGLTAPAQAWDRGNTEVFAVLPDGAAGPEGLAVGPDGNVYVTTFNFAAPATPGKLYVFGHNAPTSARTATSSTSPT